MLVEKKLYKNPLRPSPPSLLMPLRHLLTPLAKPTTQPSTPLPPTLRQRCSFALHLPFQRYFNGISTLLKR